jgi:hypothetical protein
VQNLHESRIKNPCTRGGQYLFRKECTGDTTASHTVASAFGTASWKGELLPELISVRRQLEAAARRPLLQFDIRRVPAQRSPEFIGMEAQHRRHRAEDFKRTVGVGHGLLHDIHALLSNGGAANDRDDELA